MIFAESGGVLVELMGRTLQQTNYDICREWRCAGGADGRYGSASLRHHAPLTREPPPPGHMEQGARSKPHIQVVFPTVGVDTLLSSLQKSIYAHYKIKYFNRGSM